MNSENGKTSEPHRFKLDLTDKLNLKDPKNMSLANLSITLGKTSNQNITIINLKFLLQLGNDTFDLPDGSYSIADIQDYFEFVIKKHETLTENLPVQIYQNKIKNRIVFKTDYKLDLLTPETMRLLGSTKKGVHKGKDCKNVPKLESAEVVLLIVI